MLLKADCLTNHIQIHALADLQLLGVVHNNISPPVIAVGYDGHLLLSDFSSCRVEGATAPDPLDTPYMNLPPERRSPQHKSAHSSDVWVCCSYRCAF